MLNHLTITDYKSFGQLAEMMLFYGKVSIFVYESNIRSLCKQVDPKILIPFLEEHKESISLHCIGWGLSQHGSPIFAPDGKTSVEGIAFELGDEEYLGLDEPYLKYLNRTSCLDTPDGFVKDKKLAQRLLNLIKIESVDLGFFRGLFGDEIMKKELPSFIRQFLQKYPDYYFNGKRGIKIPKDLSFTSFDWGLGLFKIRIDTKTKLTQSQFNDLFNTIYNVSWKYFFNAANLPIWANRSTEIMTTAKDSFTIRAKINRTIHAMHNSPRVINNFQEVFIPEAKSIKEVINSGEKTFMDFLKVYERGKKFKQWVMKQPDDANILKEYYKSVSSENWIDKLPNKSVRWIFFTGAGMTLDVLGGGGIGTAAGVTISALDTFILDKLINGWKPNQYIDGDLGKFLRK